MATAIIDIATGATSLLPALAPIDSATVELVALGSLLSARDRFLLGCEWNVYMFAKSGALLWRVPPPGPHAQ